MLLVRIKRLGVIGLLIAVFLAFFASAGFAQDDSFGPGFPDNEMPDLQFDPYSQPQPEIPIALIVVIALVGLAVGLAILAFISYLFANTLKAVPEQYREMSPGQAWLYMIPLFNLIWAFFLGSRIPKSYANYFAAQGRTDQGDCGATIGLWWAICNVCNLVPCLNYIAGPASFILLIVFLVKLYGLKGQIGNTATAPFAG